MINSENFWNTWLKVIGHSRSGGYIIVEGYNDKKALEHLLVEHNIYMVQVYGIEKIIEETNKNSTILILVDFDKKGEIIANKIENRLRREGFKIEKTLRTEVKKAITPIKQIEHLLNISNQLIEKAPFEIYLQLQDIEMAPLANENHL